MKKIYNIILLFTILTLPSSTNAHVLHYENLKRIEFEIFRNNKYIGKHVFSFQKSDQQLSVESKINFEIKKLGIALYKYQAQGTEIFKDGKLIKFNSTTDQNGKKKFVNLLLKNNEYIIDGSSHQGSEPIGYLLGTWWNHSIVKAEAQISAVSGRIIMQKVTFLGKETITVNDKSYNTLHYNFSSSDKKLKKNKRLNTDVWYDEKTLNWIKASFDKQGKWEYRLILIN